MASKHFKISLLFILAVILTLGLSVSFQSLLAAYTAPLANPSTCLTGNPGCDAPVSSGSALVQTTQGGMWIVNSAYPTSPYGLIVEKGNVGIGTPNPGAKLDVRGGNTGEVLFLGGVHANDWVLDIDSNNYGLISRGGYVNLVGNTRIGDTTGASHPLEVAGTAIITGNVGIGTAGPGYKLDVQGGQINSSGGLCIAGDCKTAWSQVGGSVAWANVTGRPNINPLTGSYGGVDISGSAGGYSGIYFPEQAQYLMIDGDGATGFYRPGYWMFYTNTSGDWYSSGYGWLSDRFAAKANVSHTHDYANHRGEGTNYIDYSRYIYDNGAYQGAGWKEPSSLGVYYAYLGRLVYNNGAYSGSGWMEPSDLGVRYAASAGSAGSLSNMNISQFTNNSGYITDTSGLVPKNAWWGSTYYGSNGDIYLGYWSKWLSTDLSERATHRGEGTNFIDYSRYVYNNGAYSGSGWIEPSDLGVRYANSAGSAPANGGNSDTVDGLHASQIGGSAFLGATSGSYDGIDVGGYDGGDAKCAAQFGGGARMCASSDFAKSRPWTSGWYNTFHAAMWFSEYHYNDCSGWLSNNGSYIGNIWILSGAYGGPQSSWSSCGTPNPILCCR